MNVFCSSVCSRRRTIWLLLIFLAVGFGCDGPKTTLSAQSRSPDDKIIATAYTIQTSGIGTGDPGTRVYLNWTTGSQPATIVLAFSDGSNQPGSMDVDMKWLTPTHLDLAYKGHHTVEFQAVKWHGVDISVRELPAPRE